jgi:hypothetical protein
VLGLGQAWFMDNGQHRYLTSMIGRGVSSTANRLIRVSLRDSRRLRYAGRQCDESAAGG